MNDPVANSAPRRRTRQSMIAWLPSVSLLVGLGIWWAATRTPRLPDFILPSPGLVFTRFGQALLDGSLLRHALVTLFEVMTGMALGLLTASVLGYSLAKSRSIERALSPYIIASQAVPTVAIAPLFVIWFGPGLISKILITALIVFFPILVNTVVGLRSVPEDLRDLFRSLLATPWQTFTRLEVPAALPILLGGLRIGATLSVIGAVVGEFVGADQGLGFLINVARGQYDTALVFVTIITLVILALGLYGLVVLAENRLLAWQKQPENQNT